MSEETNKALVKRFYEEVLTQRNPALVNELFSPDYVYHSSDAPPGLSTDREGLKQFITQFLKGYPDLQFTVQDQTVEGDKVVSQITARSKAAVGPVMTIPTDPQKIAEADTIRGTSADRVVNGQIAESWIQFHVPDPLPQKEELSKE